MFSRRRFLGATGLGMVASSQALLFPGLHPSDQRIDLPDERIKRKSSLKHLKNRLMGYPVNMNTLPDEFFAWRRALGEAGINQFAFNNVGNPFGQSPIPYHTHDFERDTILQFARLFGFPTPDTWGFISHSGTDSNMHGMYMGRTILKGRTGVLPKAYFTRETHYSVQILRDLLGLEMVNVATLPDGGMDPEDLIWKVSEHADSPALVVATVGTTFKGAIDHVGRIREKLTGMEHYIHVDAALFGGYLPFTDFASEIAYRADDSSAEGRYESIAVSCHKFFGFPAPAGLFITTRRLYDEFNTLFSQVHNPEYIHQVPGTITCSRDAVKPAEFYYFATPPAMARQSDDARRMLDTTTYLLDQLRAGFPQLAAVRSNPMSNTIYFRDPGRQIVQKYSLATMQLQFNGVARPYAHVIVMPHVNREVLDEFLTDLGKM